MIEGVILLLLVILRLVVLLLLLLVPRMVGIIGVHLLLLLRVLAMVLLLLLVTMAMLLLLAMVLLWVVLSVVLHMLRLLLLLVLAVEVWRMLLLARLLLLWTTQSNPLGIGPMRMIVTSGRIVAAAGAGRCSRRSGSHSRDVLLLLLALSFHLKDKKNVKKRKWERQKDHFLLLPCCCLFYRCPALHH